MLDLSSYFNASDEAHKVGTLLVGILGYRGASIHDHESFESGEEIKSLPQSPSKYSEGSSSN